MMDAVARGTLNSKTLEATQELFEKMAMNSYQWHNSRAKPSNLAHVYSVDAITTLAI